MQFSRYSALFTRVFIVSDRFIAATGNLHLVAYSMNKNLGFELIIYGMLLAGLSLVAARLAPTLTHPTLIAGLAGGVLSVVWGIRAVLGNRGKHWPILTLIPTTYVMLSQAIVSWARGSQELPAGRTLPSLITVLAVISFGMLMIIAYASEPPPKPTSSGNRNR
jgi:hypothetical protein